MAKQTQKTSYIDNDVYGKMETLMTNQDRPFNYILNELLRKGLKK